MRPGPLAALLALAGPACGLSLDLGPLEDAAPDADLGARDAGLQDAGPRPRDAAPRDTGMRDAPATSCDRVPCHEVRQCGCGADQACQVERSAGRICAAPGGGVAGDGCAGDHDCSRGLHCTTVLGESYGVCTPFCESDSACAGAGSMCVEIVRALDVGYDPPAYACTQACDPLTGDGCNGLACVLFLPTDRADWTTHCVPPGEGGAFSACATSSDCASGYRCIDPGLGVGLVCLRHCDDPGAYCPGGTYYCYPTDPPTEIGGLGYGVCA